MKKTVIYLSAIALIASCSETLTPETAPVNGEPICFSIPQDLSVKAPVFTDESLTVANAEVRIYGTKDGEGMSNYNNSLMTYNQVTGLWAPTNSDTWGYDVTGDKGLNYVFWAYAFNKVNGNVSPTITTSGDNFGKSVTLVEPAEYVHQDGGFGYDYLLSQQFNAISYKVVNGQDITYRGPVVRLHMEHALALVEVRMKVQRDLNQVILQGVEISDFYRGGTLVCSYQAVHGNSTGDINKWSVSNYSNSGSVYGRGSLEQGDGNVSVLHTFASGREEEENEISLMLFTAIPQKPSTAQLKVAMLIQEVSGGPTHQVISTWDLNNYYDWEYGYKNIYTISVDTSNKLDATIDDWPTVNNVSGTILPKI